MTDSAEHQQEEGLFDHFTNLDESTLEGESALSSYLLKPSEKNREYLGECFTYLAITIKDTLTYITEDTELADDEKASMIADVLIRDDERRQKYLTSLCQPENDNYFRRGYPDYNFVKNGLAEIIDITDDECEHGDNVVDFIMRMHVDFMNTDINDFVQSDAVAEQIYKKERREKLKQQVIQLGTIATASGLGSAVAVWLTK